MVQTLCPFQAIYFDASLSITLDIFLTIFPDYYLFSLNLLPVLSSFICQEFIFCLFAVIFCIFKGYCITLKHLILQLNNAHTFSSYIIFFKTVLWSVLWFYQLDHTFFDVQYQNLDKIFTESLSKLSRIWYFQHVLCLLFSWLDGKVRCMPFIRNSITFCFYVQTVINHIKILFWRLMIYLVL